MDAWLDANIRDAHENVLGQQETLKKMQIGAGLHSPSWLKFEMKMPVLFETFREARLATGSAR